MHWLEVIVLMFLGCSVSLAAPCLNGHPTSAEEYKQRPYVLTAKVLSSTSIADSEDGWFFAGTNYKLEPLEKLKGNVPEPLIIFSENSSGQFPMEVGRTYLLFLYQENGRLLVDSCGTSGLVESVKANLKEIRALSASRVRHGDSSKIVD
jgi:hypothetical protein